MTPLPPTPVLTVPRLLAAEAALARLLDGGEGLAALGGYAGIGQSVVGAGLNGPAGWAELRDVEEFYAARGTNAVFELSPLTDAAFLSLLQDAGYRLGSFENALVLNLTQAPPPPAVPVRAIGAAEQSDWARVAAAAYFSTDQPRAEEIAVEEPFARRTRAYVAEVDGRPAAVASLWIHDEIAFFLSDATLPAYRGRGLQQALIAQRLADAIAAGARWATANTAVSSLSQTNYLRYGFRVLYTKFTMSQST